MPRAQAGDPEFQNLIGFMFFFGEGAPMDRPESHIWFHKAADQGHVLAQRNLALMHRLGLGVPRDLKEADFYARSAEMADLERLVADMPTSRRSSMRAVGRRVTQQNLERGEATYAAFCAGCHGLNGIAAYIGSPSFALGDRLQKPDAILLYSIFQGKGVMPSWGDKLPHDRLVDTLAFARTLQTQYECGISAGIRRTPELYFLFGPMENNHAAHSNSSGE
jgi:mono/diheme cytochrome c family protein